MDLKQLTSGLQNYFFMSVKVKNQLLKRQFFIADVDYANNVAGKRGTHATMSKQNKHIDGTGNCHSFRSVAVVNRGFHKNRTRLQGFSGLRAC